MYPMCWFPVEWYLILMFFSWTAFGKYVQRVLPNQSLVPQDTWSLQEDSEPWSKLWNIPTLLHFFHDRHPLASGHAWMDFIFLVKFSPDPFGSTSYLDRVPAWIWKVTQKQVGWGTWLDLPSFVRCWSKSTWKWSCATRPSEVQAPPNKLCWSKKTKVMVQPIRWKFEQWFLRLTIQWLQCWR